MRSDHLRKAVVLLSGGIDSSTALAIAGDMGYKVHALTILYGQRHEREVESAKMVANAFNVEEHRIMELPEGLFSASALTYDGDVPVDGYLERDGIPSTYVPARNLVFLSIAVSWAEAMDADAVFIGVTSVDYSGYPDCRGEFIEAFREASALATRRGVEGNPVKILTPLIDLSKGDIIRRGMELGLDYSLTWSCYKGGERACGRCDSCRYRLKGFREAGIDDPLEYEDDSYGTVH